MQASGCQLLEGDWGARPRLALSVFCQPLLSQTNLGRIFGGVTDQSGGVIAGAKVTVTDVDRGITQILTTDAAGEYNATNLIPGMYEIRAEFTGFQAVNRQNVDVLVGQELRVDLTLQPGAQTQTITITEAVPLVTTTSATMTATIETWILASCRLTAETSRA